MEYFVFLAIAGMNLLALEPSDSLRITYNVCVDVEADNYEVFVMDLDGTGKKNISNWKGVDWVYAAYGDRIFFISDRASDHRKYHLYEMDCNGENLRQITEFLLEDSWLDTRKNGQELIVSGKKDGARHDLFLIDRQGLVIKRVTENQVYENDPSFSPDGSHIVYRSKASGIDELWVMELALGKTYQLTHYSEDANGQERYGYHAGPPFWEPTKNIISFASMRGGRHQLYTIKPDGSDLKLLVDFPGEQVYHAWSPDGEWLAFDSKNEEGHYNIYLLKVATKGITQLTHSPQIEQAPVFVQSTP